MGVPNQKKITIAKREKRDREHLYATMNIEALEMAVKNLNGSGLKLWLYMNKNQDNYSFDLSQVACADFGIKKDSYYKAITELIGKGYLIPAYEGSNIFYFYEKPQKENNDEYKWFSEETNLISENEKKISENPSLISEKAERNNTNITLTNKDNTEYNSEDFEEMIYQKSKIQFEELKQLYPKMNHKQRIEYTKMNCMLNSLSPVYFDKTKKAKIISEAYKKIFNTEVM